ncbi:MAG: hypothetical protein JW720_15960 [Sedimentisphaerales bacterium]|nr:hypothetical protein [Sedimentisphaerales bacterium]
MEANNYLGIYISKDSATVVCFDANSKGESIVGCFSVRAEDGQEDSPHILASLISRGCAEREWLFSGASVALDCAMFMQHNVHSAFTDARQISTTVRFDTEEALATDIGDVAIAFQVVSSGDDGSDLTVFSAKKKLLSDILLALQSSGIDPVGIVPDVECLSRYVQSTLLRDNREQRRTMFGILSARRGYLTVTSPDGSESGRPARVRTFLVGPTKDREGLLAREAIMTLALGDSNEPISQVGIFDFAGVVEPERIGAKLGIEAAPVELVGPGVVDEQVLADCPDRVEFAIAYGAGLSLFGKSPAVNFRDDFMPFQGTKVRLQKAVRFFGVSLTILLVAAGLYFQTQLFGVNKYRNRVKDRVMKDYAVAMSNKKIRGKFTADKALKSLKDEKKRLGKPNEPGGDDSVSAKLTKLLDAFNKSATQTRLQITKVSIAAKSITISGSTSSRANTNRFFDIVRASGLDIVKTGLTPESGLDKFVISVALR